MNLFDNPPNLVEDDAEPDYSKMTPAERKKAKAQARKKKKKAEKKAEEEAKKAEEEEKDKKNKNKENRPKDTDPDGKELLKMDPLEQAKKYTSSLVKNAPNRLTTWLLQYDVSIRRKKYLLALQALNKANKIESYTSNGEIFSRMIEFASLEIQPHENKEIQAMFQREKMVLCGNRNMIVFVNHVIAQIDDEKSNMSMKVAVAKALKLLGIGSSKIACEMITRNGLEIHGATLLSCIEGSNFLDTLNVEESGDTKELVDKWRILAKGRFCHSSQFS